MTQLTMPRLSDSMQQGTIITWLKTDGEHVQTGEELLEIETDKATVTHAAEASGKLQIVAPAGETLPVGAPIAQLHDTADHQPARAHPTPPRNNASPWDEGQATASAGTVATLPAPTDDEGPPPQTAGRAPTAQEGRSRSTREGAPSGGVGAPAAAVEATPLARRIATQHGVSLLDVPGSGPRGRVTRADVLARAGLTPATSPARAPSDGEGSTPAAASAPAPPATTTPSSAGDIETVRLSRLQTVVAQRMAEAKATIPHFQVQTEVQMDHAVALREQLKQTVATAPSLSDLIVKAAALALCEHPLANGSYRDGQFELHQRVNIGVAVAADSALVVPTIFDADRKSLSTIARETRRLAARVRDQTITPPELSGATFTVSNLGMYGMTAIAPVINPPQAAILGVGALRPVIQRADDQLVDSQLLTLTLSCDHRILYGADAARFLSAIRDLLECPLRLVL